jgi:probable HAF family extracellular repeat protein
MVRDSRTSRSVRSLGWCGLPSRMTIAVLVTVGCGTEGSIAPPTSDATTLEPTASMGKGPPSSGGGGVAIAILDLGAGDGSVAEAVNDRGQVVGTGGTGVGAFVWENGVLRQIPAPPGMTYVHAEDINESGQVVGYANNADGSVYRAFIWTADAGTQLLAGSLGGCCTLARGINDQGVVVGEARLSGTGAHTVVWENGVMRDIQSFASGSTFPWDISNAGVAVGQWDGPNGAFMWTNGGGMITMAGLEGPGDIPIGVNDLGQIVGWYRRTSTVAGTAFLWTNGVITDLGTLGGASSVAWAVNNSGQAVGRADRPRKGAQSVFRAFIWTAADGMKDLGSITGRDWAQARDLNEVGWVVGETYVGSGASRATLWKLK